MYSQFKNTRAYNKTYCAKKKITEGNFGLKLFFQITETTRGSAKRTADVTDKFKILYIKHP